MGYDTEIIGCNLSIPRKNLETACHDGAVLAALSSKRYTPDISTPEKLMEHFIGGVGHTEYDRDGDLIDLEYREGRYSWIFKCLNVLAPFVPDGNWVEFVGEDHEYSRLYFKGGRMIEQKPVVTKIYPEVK